MIDQIYSKAQELLLSADREIEGKNYSKASEFLDSGIAQLGDEYLDKNTVDDSSLKLTLAQVKQRDGSVEQAVNLKKSVLTARLGMYKKKMGCDEH